MMKKLPKKLKSGRRLVATAADRHVGLYRGGTKEDRTWRIAYATGRVERGMAGSKGYPIAPEGQKWTWLRTKKRRKQEREAKRARTRIDPRAGRLSGKKKEKSEKVRISKTLICVDCKKDSMRKISHSHTYAHETKGYAVTLCCRCARKKRGYKCPIRRQARIDRKRAEEEAVAASETRRLQKVLKTLKRGRKLSKKEKIKILKAEGFTKKKRKLYDLS